VIGQEQMLRVVAPGPIMHTRYIHHRHNPGRGAMPQGREAFEPPNELLEAYDSRHMALGLGAGVSQQSGMPSWTELLLRLADKLPGIGRQSAQALLDEGYDPTVLATILRSKAGNDADFAEAVRNALYRDFPFKERLIRDVYSQLTTHVRETNPTLHAVGTLCGVAMPDGTYRPNPHVRAVLTLNLDGLLQIYTRARFGEILLRTIERASASASGEKLHCYHLHGYLKHARSSGNRPQESSEAPDRLILTEQQYFDVVANANGFVNYTMLHQLRQRKFLFVGLSMRDGNLRRALHLSFRERIRELMAEGETEPEARRRSTRHWAVMMRQGAELNAATATLLEVIGVQPLWITAWSDIPALLKALYERAGRHRWADVA
jgi:SIR2-like domain